MCQINTLRTFRWRHLLVKPERTYAYTWYEGSRSFGAHLPNYNIVTCMCVTIDGVWIGEWIY
jgi:hypothetical protein